MKKINILLVEDDINFRTGLVQLINQNCSNFYIMDTAVNGKDAINLLKKNHYAYNLVITDINMPIINGIELTKHVSSIYPHLPIVCLSAYDEFEFVKESLMLGAKDYILKQDITPLNIQEKLDQIWGNIKSKSGTITLEAQFKEYIHSPDEANLDALWAKLSLPDGVAAALLRISFEGTCAKNLLEELKTELAHLRIQAQITCLSTEELALLYTFSCEDYVSDDQLLFRTAKILAHLNVQPRFLLITDFIKSKGTLSDGHKMIGQMKEYANLNTATKELRPGIFQSILAGRKEHYSFFKDSASSALLDTLSLEAVIAAMRESMISNFPEKEYINNDFYQLLSWFMQSERITLSSIDQMNFVDVIKSKERLDEKIIFLKDYIHKLTENHSFYKGNNPEITKAIAYIKENFASDLMLYEIAGHIGLSENYFSNLFKTETGINVKNYINLLRVEKAKILLRTTNLRAYEIAERVGFKNATYFSTVFKSVTKQSLSDFKQKPL